MRFNDDNDEHQLIRWEYVGTARKEFAYDGLGRLRVRQDYLGTVAEPSQPGERSLRRLSFRKLNGQPLWVCLLAR